MFDTSTGENSALNWIREFLYDGYGIHITDKKADNLRSKLQKRLRDLEFNDLEGYAEYLESHPEEVPRFLDVVSTNKTYFFREQTHWNFMTDTLIPNWMDQQLPEINIWSVPCSTGEEPYTVALLLEEAQKKHGSLAYRILASDLSRKVLRKGVRGKYSDRDVQPIRDQRPGLLDRYFERTEDDQWQIDESIRRKVVFREYNLKQEHPLFEETFHLIISRNVFIYFDHRTSQAVVDKLETALEPGGVLFIGHTESLRELDTNLRRVQPSIYRKPDH